MKWIIMHVVKTEPVFRGQERVSRILVREDEIVAIEELDSGLCQATLRDGTQLLIRDSLDEMRSFLGPCS